MNPIDWLPEIPEPFDPDKREIWLRMTSRERKLSWLLDLLLVVVGTILVSYFITVVVENQ